MKRVLRSGYVQIGSTDYTLLREGVGGWGHNHEKSQDCVRTSLELPTSRLPPGPSCAVSVCVIMGTECVVCSEPA